jgi:hypothetical protein
VNDVSTPLDSWQGWLDAFLNEMSLGGWTEFMQTASADIEPWQWAALFGLGAQASLARAMLLAVIQLPEADAEKALASISRQVHAIRFEKPPRSMKRDLKELFRETSKGMLRDLPSTVDFLHTVFLHYLHNDYDLEGDANLLIREARVLIEMPQRKRALDMAGRAGAAALRGKPIWSGWADEGTSEFRQWALVLTSQLEGLQALGVLPLGAVADERLHAAERVQQLIPHEPRLPAQPVPPDSQDDAMTQEFITEWIELAKREEPLTDREIAALGERYELFVQAALNALALGEQVALEVPSEQVLAMAALTLGILRSSALHVINSLIDLARDVEYGDETRDSAFWALEQIGLPALSSVFDFVRYTGDTFMRDDMLEVLGFVGRGSQDVYMYLAAQFREATWDNEKAMYARPLALLHDPRAVSLLVDALSDPAADEDDVFELLDGLEELDVKFSVNHARHSVSLPDGSVIPDVLPEDWLPRAERPMLEDAEEELWSGQEWGDEDEEDEDVVFDAHGIARCANCGAVMHRVNNRWQHPPLDEPPQRTRPIRVESIGRNDPCPCGSGKKYKHCHGKPGAPALN